MCQLGKWTPSFSVFPTEEIKSFVLLKSYFNAVLSPQLQIHQRDILLSDLKDEKAISPAETGEFMPMPLFRAAL